MVSPASAFREELALPLGKTPLLRLMPLAGSGSSVRITKAGYQAWEGKLSLAASEIKAELVPLTEAQKRDLGWFVSPPCRRLTVVPVRMGVQKIGSNTNRFAVSPEAEAFTNRFLTAFRTTMSQRFGSQAALAQPAALVTEAFWQRLAGLMQGISVATIGYTPVPKRLEFMADENASLAALDGAVLLVRAEARYVGGGTVFVRTAIPLLLTAGSAAAGYSVANATGSPSYTYTVFGPAPSSDAVLVQMFLVHSGTHELMWFGQVILPQYFKHPQVTEKAATKAAEQVPAAFLGDSKSGREAADTNANAGSTPLNH
jgi:hypothetical protein